VKLNLNNMVKYHRGDRAEIKSLSAGFVVRWLLALSLFGVMGLGLSIGSAKLLDPQILPFKVVRIEGDFKYLDRHELEQVVGAEIRGGFFTVNVDAVRAKALQLPWVAEAAVRRVWPDTLLIKVVEQIPLARWGGKLLVNQNAELFQSTGQKMPADLPQLIGPEGTEIEVVTNYRVVRSVFEPLGLRVIKLQLDPRRAWTLGFSDGSSIRVGNRDVKQRMARFSRLYPRLKAAGLGQLKQVDLRYTNGLVVHWDQSEMKSQAAQSVDKSTKSKELG